MPRNVRNFYSTLSIDGQKKTVGGGPQSSTGGMSVSLLVRENARISDTKFKIECEHIDGQNLVKFYRDEQLIFEEDFTR